MELIDRYLHAVKFWLPKEQKQDIIAELSEDVRSQIEEKEGELGRDRARPKWLRFLSKSALRYSWRPGSCRNSI